MSGPRIPTTNPVRPATVLYDDERSSTGSLAPPDMDEILKKRHPWRPLLRLEFHRAVQLPLTCTAVAVCALLANGVYSFPTYGPVIARQLELDSKQLQTIVVGGILGVYLSAGPVGALTDRLGPRGSALISCVLGIIGYQTFGVLLRSSPDTPYLNVYLTLAFAVVGASSVGSYFAALTCASLSFPSHPTLALSFPLTCVGFSSLFISSFSNLAIFREAQTNEVDAHKYIVFLGILIPAINLFGAMFMRILPPAPIQLLDDPILDPPESPLGQRLHLDEHTPLLIGGPAAALEDIEAIEDGTKEQWTTMRLLKDVGGFWSFGVILALCIGPGETILSSVGSILTSLLPPPNALAILTAAPDALALRNKHVTILSLTSTVSRLCTGFLADYLAPPLQAVPVPDQDGDTAPRHKFVRTSPVRLWRTTFAAICALIMGLVFAVEGAFLQTERGLWVLSAGVGSMYGALFTITPSIISSHYGPTNFGLAWGLIFYFPAAAAAGYSYIYAVLSVAHTDLPENNLFSITKKTATPSVICYGTQCFRSFFWICAPCCVIASIGLFVMSRRWKI